MHDNIVYSHTEVVKTSAHIKTLHYDIVNCSNTYTG